MADATAAAAATTDATTTPTDTGSAAAPAGTAPAGGATAAPADGTATQGAVTPATDATAATTSADWRAGITDPDVKEAALRLASPADAVKHAVEMRKKMGSMIRVPGKDATPEDKANFNKAIGVPETVEGYTFDLGREATDADKAIQGNLAKVAFENGVPATAMSALTKAVAEMAGVQKAEENRIAVAARAANEAALRKEWGADYEANKTLATRAVQAFGEIKSHPEVLEMFDKTIVNGQKLGDHPVLVRMMGNIGRRMGEGEFIGAVGAEQRSSLQTEMNQIIADNPVGSTGYRQPAVQKRIMEINEALHGTEGIVGRGGRSA